MWIAGYVALSLVAFIISSDAALVSWKTYVQLGFAIAAIAVTIIFYVAKKGSMTCVKGMVGAVLSLYVVLRLVGATEDNCIYALPIILATVVRRHTVGGTKRTLISALLPSRLCRTGTYCRLWPERPQIIVALFERQLMLLLK